jgi:hypothetical protein
MGTRGLVGFTVNGQHLLTYNHFDSYPSGLGAQTFRWLKDRLVTIEDKVVLSPDVTDKLGHLEIVDESASPNDDQLRKLQANGFAPQRVSNGRDFYSWLRDAQGDLGALIKSGFWIDDGYEFGKDSLFCEWGYVIDVDARRFDVYQGFQKSVPTEGIWARVENEPGEYQPVRRIYSLPFAECLTTDETEINALEDIEDEDA